MLERILLAVRKHETLNFVLWVRLCSRISPNPNRSLPSQQEALVAGPGKNLIVAAFQKHAAQMRRVFSALSAGELRDFEMALKRIGKRAAGLMENGSAVSVSKKETGNE
jgi:hypothetical protein